MSGTRDAWRGLERGKNPGEVSKLRRGSAVGFGCNSPAAVRIHYRSNALEAEKARDASA